MVVVFFQSKCHSGENRSTTPHGSIDLDESSTVGSFHESTIRRIVDRRLVENPFNWAWMSPWGNMTNLFLFWIFKVYHYSVDGGITFCLLSIAVGHLIREIAVCWNLWWDKSRRCPTIAQPVIHNQRRLLFGEFICKVLLASLKGAFRWKRLFF